MPSLGAPGTPGAPRAPRKARLVVGILVKYPQWPVQVVTPGGCGGRGASSAPGTCGLLLDPFPSVSLLLSAPGRQWGDSSTSVQDRSFS